MATIRAIKVSGEFVIIHKGFLKDPNLSAKAKGVMAYILSLPDDWKIHIDELSTHFKDGRDSIRKAIKELQEAGYIERVRIRDENGKFKGWEYLLYEDLTHKTEKPKSENPISVKPISENPTLLNNNITNNDLTNNKLNYIAENEFSADSDFKNEEIESESTSLSSSDLKTDNKSIGLAAEKNSSEDALKDNGKRRAKMQTKGVIPDEKEKGEEQAREKDLLQQITSIFAGVYYNKTGLKYPSKEYGKLKNIIKRKFIPVILEFAKQQGWDDEEIIWRTKVIVEYYSRQGIFKPEVVFGTPASTIAEIKRIMNDKSHYKHKIIKEILQEVE